MTITTLSTERLPQFATGAPVLKAINLNNYIQLFIPITVVMLVRIVTKILITHLII